MDKIKNDIKVTTAELKRLNLSRESWINNIVRIFKAERSEAEGMYDKIFGGCEPVQISGSMQPLNINDMLLNEFKPCIKKND